jgi:hypothetical protein
VTDPFAAVEGLAFDTKFPDLIPVRQHIAAPAVADVEASTRSALSSLGDLTGKRVCVTAGSRGIASLATILRTAIAVLRERGADPFVVPAMGSHGGATAEGQLGILSGIGVTEDSVGAPIESGMDTVVLEQLAGGPEVHVDARAAAADAILLVNRIKPHTTFRGEVESGLAKIAAIGLGKQHGAEAIHLHGPVQLGRWIPAAYRALAATGKVLGGVAILENAHHDVAKVAFLSAEGIGADGEAALLNEARELLPRLPFDELDVLVVDEFGKDKSGAGMDPNVLGRMGIPGIAELPTPRITNVTVHHLTEASHGNGIGVGLADLVPLRVVRQIDLRQTYVNGLTAGLSGLRRARLPVVLPTDRDVIASAMRSCGVADPSAVRLVRVRDTLDLETMLVSASLRAEVDANPALTVLGPASPMTFGPEGDLA